MLHFSTGDREVTDFRFLIAEPRRWSAADVAAWVQWARRQLQLPSVPMESFNVDGATLASLTEEEFCQRAPQVSVNILLSAFTLVETETWAIIQMITKYSSCLSFFLRGKDFTERHLFLRLFHFRYYILRVKIEFARLKYFNT